MLAKTEYFQSASDLDIANISAQLIDEFGEDLLMQAAVWITLGESRASFAIEERPKLADNDLYDRIIEALREAFV